MSDRPSIAVVGVGAIGGAMSAALGDVGHSPALCVRTPFRDLSRRLDGETRAYAHPVHSHPDGISSVDWLLLCTKAHQIAGAATWLDRLIGPGTRVAVMQNGIDHVQRVAEYVEPERVVPCIVQLPAKVESPGIVEQGRAGAVRVPDSPLGHELAALFGEQGAVKVVVTEDFVSALWTKLVSNAVGGAICALTLKPLRSLVAPEARELVTCLMHETMRVGEAEGAVFPEDFVESSMQAYHGPLGEHWTSIAMDRREARSMEWQARNAIVCELGRRHDIPTPLNDAMTALLAIADARS